MRIEKHKGVASRCHQFFPSNVNFLFFPIFAPKAIALHFFQFSKVKVLIWNCAHLNTQGSSFALPPIFPLKSKFFIFYHFSTQGYSLAFFFQFSKVKVLIWNCAHLNTRDSSFALPPIFPLKLKFFIFFYHFCTLGYSLAFFPIFEGKGIDLELCAFKHTWQYLCVATNISPQIEIFYFFPFLHPRL